MNIQNNLPKFSVIQAAVSGEQWAVDQIVAHYEGFINEQSMVETVQPDGSVRKCVDEELRKQLVQKLIEEIPHFKTERSQSAE